MLTKPPLVIDTCVISNFYHGNSLELLKELYANKIIIPNEVAKECIRYGPLRREFERLDKEEWYQIYSITDISHLLIYREVERRCKGYGETAVLTIAQIKNGTACSDNLSDIRSYVNEKNIPLMTTITVLYDAYIKGLINEVEGENIIQTMKQNGRILVVEHFKDILNSFENNTGHILI